MGRLPSALPLLLPTLLLSLDTRSVLVSAADDQVKVLSWNVWIADRSPLIIDIVKGSGADIVAFQELDQNNPSNIVSALEAATGQDWHVHDQSSSLQSGISIISRYPILGGDKWGAEVQLGPQTTAWLFNVHMSPYPYQPYDLRDGKLPAHDEAAVIAAANSARGENVAGLLDAIAKSGAMNSSAPLFVVGDFNEPSHLDWTQAAADATTRPYDFKVEYPASKRMVDFGLVDAFRSLRPDEVNDPGYTWSPGYPPPIVGSTEVHDRIDFIYYAPGDKNVVATDVLNIGYDINNPNTDISFAGYPSDHRAVLATFDVEGAKYIDDEYEHDEFESTTTSSAAAKSAPFRKWRKS